MIQRNPTHPDLYHCTVGAFAPVTGCPYTHVVLLRGRGMAAVAGILDQVDLTALFQSTGGVIAMTAIRMAQIVDRTPTTSTLLPTTWARYRIHDPHHSRPDIIASREVVDATMAILADRPPAGLAYWEVGDPSTITIVNPRWYADALYASGETPPAGKDHTTVALWRAGMRVIAQIAKALRGTRGAVYHHLDQAGIQPRRQIS